MEFVKAERKKKTTEEANIGQRLLNWPDCFYRERDPAIRLELFEEAVRQGLTPEDNDFRRKIFDLRYDMPRKGSEGVPVDGFIKAWMDLRFLGENRKGLFAKGNDRRFRKVMEEGLGFGMVTNQTEENLLYQELYHLGMLYIALCREDKNYNSLVFGLGTISGDRQARKIAAEVKRIAVDVPETYGAGEKYALLTRALKEAYYDTFPDYEGILDD